MPNGQRALPPGLPLIGALVLLGLGGFFIRSAPLKQLRPAPSAPLWSEAEEAGSVPARMWQDPLQAIGAASARQQSSSTAKEEVETNDSLRARVARQSAPWTVLVALVTGSNYSDSESSRIENRLALVGGLAEAGFVPENRERLGFVLWRSPALCDRGQIAVPYEWFSRDHASGFENGNVLVLWLRSDALAPGATLEGVRSLLHDAVGRGSSGTHGPMTGAPGTRAPRPEAILLTTGSNRLIDIATELGQGSAPGTRRDELSSPQYALLSWWQLAPRHVREEVEYMLGENRLPLRVIDWSATIETRQLIETLAARFPAARSAPTEVAREGAVRELLAKRSEEQGVTIERRIGTDAELMGLVAHELALRGIVGGEQGAHVAIVHEWDTAYGRALPRTFAAAMGVAGDAPPSWLHTYSYLQGIDGVLPTGTNQASEESKLATERAADAALYAETPEGRNQLDYIRRLASKIREDASRWPSGDRVAAIGVFGQVYDKVPVLQALRDAFPDAVLFTTDLEARLVHASADGSLRNLLIASHYGLHADEHLQASTPPFRSSYQTSLYLAVRTALQPSPQGPVRSAPTIDLDGLRGISRMYEIGRTGVHDLLTRDDPHAAPPEEIGPANARYALHPRTDAPRTLGGWTIAGGCFAIFGGLAIFVFARRVPVAGVRRRTDDPNDVAVGTIDLVPLARTAAGAAMALLAAAAILGSRGGMAQTLARRLVITLSAESSWVVRFAALLPDVLVLVATIGTVRSAFLVARARYRDPRDARDTATDASNRGRLLVSVPVVLAFLVMSTVALQLYALDEITSTTRAVGGSIAFVVGILVGYQLSDRRRWLARCIQGSRRRRITTIATIPILYLIALVPRALPPGAGLGAVAIQVSYLAPPILALAACLAGVLLFAEPIGPPPQDERREEWRRLLGSRNWSMFATASVVFVVACFCIELFDRLPDEEPIAFWEGISAWPSIALRMLAVILGLWFLSVLRDDATTNARTVTRDWNLLDAAQAASALRTSKAGMREATTIGWTGAEARREADASPTLTFGTALWKQYLQRGRFRARIARVLALTVLFAMLVLPFVPAIWQTSQAPFAVRGDIARELHRIAFLASFAVATIVTLAVWDVSNLCQRFIALVAIDPRASSNDESARTWPQASLDCVRSSLGLRGDAADAYLTVRVVADRTRWVAGTIYYPFVLIVLLLVAGASGFDAWPHSWRVVVAFSFPAVIALLSAWSLQSAAKRMREQVLERLGRAVGTRVDPTPLDDPTGGSIPLAPASALDLLRKEPACHVSMVRWNATAATVAAPNDATAKVAATIEAKPDVEPAARFIDLCTTSGDDLALAIPLNCTSACGPDGRCVVPIGAGGEELVLTLERDPQRVQRPRYRVTEAARQVAARLVDADVKNARTLAEGIRFGAFASPADNPVLRALLLPFGGFGAIQLVDYIARAM